MHSDLATFPGHTGAGNEARLELRVNVSPGLLCYSVCLMSILPTACEFLQVKGLI